MTFSKLLPAYALLLLTVTTAWSQPYQWHRAAVPSGPWHSIAFNPLSHGRVIFAGSGLSDGVYRSDDAGITWKQTATPPDYPMNDIHQIFCSPGDTNVVLAVTPTNFYRSTDGGWHWSDTSTLFGVDGEAIAFNNKEGAIYYPQDVGGYIWKSADEGATWKQTTPIHSPEGVTFDAAGVSQDVPPMIIEGSADSLLEWSSDEGITWHVGFTEEPIGSGGAEVPKVVFSYYAVDPDDTMHHDVAIAILWRSFFNSILATPDGGRSWQALHSPNRHAWALDIDQRRSMISIPGEHIYPLPRHFFTGLYEDPGETEPMPDVMQETTNGGYTWHGMGLPPGAGDSVVRQIWVVKYDTTSGHMAVAADRGVFVADLGTGGVAATSATSREFSIEQSRGNLAIRASSPIVSCNLYDIVGRKVASLATAGTTLHIETGHFAPGVYELSIQLEGHPPVTRLVTLP